MSQWNTPVATAVAPSTPEPISVILLKHTLDVNERVRQVSATLLPDAAKSRLLTDASAVVDQLPNLLLLLKEASSPTAYLTEESGSRLMDLFSLKSPKSISRFLLQQGTTSFVFPLTSLPASIDWSSSDFSFYRLLSYISQRTKLVDLHAKTIHLDAIDYYFFVLGALSIVADTSVQSSTLKWTGSQWAGDSWGTSRTWGAASSSASAWYDSGSKGRIYDRILSEIVEIVSGDVIASQGVPPLLAHKAELTFAVFSDFLLDLNLYSFNNTSVDFSHIFQLLTRTLNVVIPASLDKTSHSLTTPVGSFPTRLGKLLVDLFDANNFYSIKFMHRALYGVFREMAKCYRQFGIPWEDRKPEVSVAAKDAWIKRHAEVYKSLSSVLTCPPVIEFASEFKLHSNTSARLNQFVSSMDAKNLVEALADIMSIASPSTGLVEALPNAFLSAPIKALWHICRACTWIGGKVPHNMTDASWRMDQIVNAAKSASSDIAGIKQFYSIFTWEVPADESPEKITDSIPKRLTDIPVMKTAVRTHAFVKQSWDQPVCASEVVFVLVLLKYVVGTLTEVDLKRHPGHLAWVRSLASSSVLTLTAFFSWMIVSIALCPYLSSAMTIAVIQFIFVVIVGVLAMKWISSQYIV